MVDDLDFRRGRQKYQYACHDSCHVNGCHANETDNLFERVASMSDEVPLEVIQKTQKILGKYVKKPPLTEKLLKRPPFRFLHDVINVVIKETGFLKGLYSETELKSDNVKEKNAKLSFLSKLIDAISKSY